jgi:hypothetical protein
MLQPTGTVRGIDLTLEEGMNGHILKNLMEKIHSFGQKTPYEDLVLPTRCKITPKIFIQFKARSLDERSQEQPIKSRL